MPDNVGYTPGSGATVAADDVGGVLHQRVKLSVGQDGSASDVSPTNGLPIEIISEGEIAEQLEAIRYYLQIIASSIGSAFPNTLGQLRVALESATSGVTIPSVTTVTTVSTVSTVSSMTNVVSVGNVPGFNEPMASLKLVASNLRRNITV